MPINTRFRSSNTDTMDSLMASAKARYTRPDKPDAGGASNTVYNMARGINRSNGDTVNLSQLPPKVGTFEDAKSYYTKGQIVTCLAVLKHIQTQMLYGSYTFN